MANPLHHVLLLITVASISLSAATSPPPTPSSVDHTHPLHLFGPVLSSLGFTSFAASAASLPSTTTWRGPITVFAPTDSSLLTCPACSVPLLLHEHTLPGLFPLPYLHSLLPGTKLETLAPGRCLTVTSDRTSSKVFVSGVEITHPGLYNDGLVVVHGLQGFVSHLSPDSCSLERATSLSFLPHAATSASAAAALPPPPDSLIMRLMLKDAILRLRISGYSVLAVALKVKYAELVDLKSLTVFALDDVSIFSGAGHEYVTNFRCHVVPNRLLMAGDLYHLPQGTVLPTTEIGREIVVTSSGGGGSPVRINYVKVQTPDLMFNLKVAVHGLSMPFPRVNLTAAIATATSVQNQRSGYSEAAGGSSTVMAGNAAIGYSVAPSIQWTAEMEDHHGL